MTGPINTVMITVYGKEDLQKQMQFAKWATLLILIEKFTKSTVHLVSKLKKNFLNLTIWATGLKTFTKAMLRSLKARAKKNVDKWLLRLNLVQKVQIFLKH